MPAIPAKPTGRTKPGHAQTAARPPRPVEQFDLWMLFAGSEEPSETIPPRSAKTVPRPKKGK